MSGVTADNVGRSSGLVKAAGGGGKIGQVVYTSFTTEATGTNTSWADVSGYSAVLTPAATTSKILCRAMGVCGASVRSMSLNLKLTYNHSGISATDVVLGASPVVTGGVVGTPTHWGSGEEFAASGDSVTNTTRTYCLEGLVTPSTTNEVTIQVAIIQPDSNVSYTWYLNRSHTRGGGVQDSNSAASLTIMEILA